jgi:hypothetical protein
MQFLFLCFDPSRIDQNMRRRTAGRDALDPEGSGRPLSLQFPALSILGFGGGAAIMLHGSVGLSTLYTAFPWQVYLMADGL